MRRALLVPTAALAFAACAHRPPPPAAPAPPPAAAARPAPAPDPLPSAIPPPDLAPVRDEVAAVLKGQAEAYWLLFTEGRKVDGASAWRGHEGLLSDANLAAAARDAREGPTDQRRPSAYLSAWLVGERLTRDTAEASRQVSRARDEARFLWGDHLVSLRDVIDLLAGERDHDRRRAIARAASTAAREVVALAAAREGRIGAAAVALGYPSALALAAELRDAAPPALAAQAEEVLSTTEGAWQALLAAQARAEGMRREEVRRYDLPRLLRTQVPARSFPAGRHLTEGAALLAGMGIDLAGQANLHVASGAHPIPLSIALPVDPPGDVRLSVAAVAGLDAARAALHELGMAEYYAHVRVEPMGIRRLGPAAVPEAWALLLEDVTGAPPWLAAHGLDEGQVRREARAAAGRRLYRARGLAARVLAALARAEGAGEAREAALLARANGCPVEEGDILPWRLEPDPLLHAAEELRAELLAAQLDLQLARVAGAPEWWRSPAAGAWLTAAWAEGSRRTPEERARILGEKGLDAGALVRVVRARAGL